MDAHQRKRVIGAALLVVLGWLISPLLATRQPQPSVNGDLRLRFDARRALTLARQFVTAHPTRVLGSIESRQSTGFLREVLAPLGYELEYQHFDATIAGVRQVGRNVLVLRPGSEQEIIAVVAHYDTAATAVQGASDNGAAVGVLLELATIFADVSPRRGLLFIASDGEEWGMLGAADLARNYENRSRIAAVISLDGIAPGPAAGLALETVGQMRGYTPAWLRSLAAAAAAAEGLETDEAFGAREYFERALPISRTDQGPFLGEGMAAVNLATVAAEPGQARRLLHSAEDTIDRIRPEAVAALGRTAERLIRILDSFETMPADTQGYFQVIPGRFVSPAVVTALHLLCIIPFALILGYWWRNYNDFLSVELLQWESVFFIGAWGPLVIGYGALLLFYGLGFIPQYSLYPPPPRDPIAAHPSWGILWAIAGVVAITAVILYFIGRWLTRKVTKPQFHASKLVLLMVLGLILAASILHNVYWAVSFIVLPSLCFGWSPGGRRGQAWVMAAAVPLLVVLAVYAYSFDVGLGIFWLQAIALGTGLFTVQGFLLASAATAVGIRMIAIQSAGAPRPEGGDKSSHTAPGEGAV